MKSTASASVHRLALVIGVSEQHLRAASDSFVLLCGLACLLFLFSKRQDAQLQMVCCVRVILTPQLRVHARIREQLLVNFNAHHGAHRNNNATIIIFNG